MVVLSRPNPRKPIMSDTETSGKDDVEPESPPRPLERLRAPRLVVAVGASAGGLESLERLFARVPDDTGLAFVIVQHLSPHHKTMMVELLARRTDLDVRTAVHGVAVRRDTVHVLPPGKRMTIAKGRLQLDSDIGDEQPNLPIDRFFVSLAADAGERAVAIVLSGTGSDGTVGIADVKAEGGLVLAETEVTAAFSGMPDNAVASGHVDYSLAPEEMIEILVEHAGRVAGDVGVATGGEERQVGRVLELLHERHGIDFTRYKAGTIGRRIERRVQLAGGDGALGGYVGRLEDDPDELDLLYHDLLIGVTRFFRDEACFEKLELEVLPRLFRKLDPERPFRAWCAGCATGEEPYSLAMLVREQIEALGQPIEAKIFATDLHRGALAHAGLGVYAEEQLENVSAARRARHFEKHPDGFRVVDAVRQHVVFARHDVLADAPFTRLDLVVCRNLLIYFELPAQSKALRLFHFALRKGGAAMLGPSETLGPVADRFEPVDESCRLFRKSDDDRPTGDFHFEPPKLEDTSTRRRAGARPRAQGRVDTRLIDAYDHLLNRHMAPSVLIDAEDCVVDSYGGAARLLHYPSRRPDNRLQTALRGEGVGAVMDAVGHVRRTGDGTTVGAVSLEDAGGRAVERGVRVEPIPAPSGGPGEFVLVYLSSDTERPFERSPPPAEAGAPVPDVSSPDASGTDAPTPDADVAADGTVAALREEISTLRARLQRASEAAETGSEELQATNEELVASNEELQSSNEELNSINEELHTVNGEYQQKIGELRELNEDMDQLLATTDIGTLFLDVDLRIRRVTNGIERAYDLTRDDVGRSIEAFSHRLDVDDLPARMREVMATGRPYEREVRDREGRAFLLRLQPYRLSEQIAGVVMSIVDIALLDDARTALADSEASLRRRLAELQTLYETTPVGLSFFDRDLRYVRANARMAAIDGVNLNDYAGRLVGEVLPPALAARVEPLLRGVIDTDEPLVNARVQARTRAHPDEDRDYVVNYYPVPDGVGGVMGVSCVIHEPLFDGAGAPDDDAGGTDGAR